MAPDPGSRNFNAGGWAGRCRAGPQRAALAGAAGVYIQSVLETRVQRHVSAGGRVCVATLCIASKSAGPRRNRDGGPATHGPPQPDGRYDQQPGPQPAAFRGQPDRFFSGPFWCGGGPVEHRTLPPCKLAARWLTRALAHTSAALSLLPSESEKVCVCVREGARGRGRERERARERGSARSWAGRS